jgi:hypothetical protein
MTDLLPDLLVSAGTIAGAVGGSFFGLKASLNGTRKKVDEIHVDVKEVFRLANDSNIRISVLEVRHDNLAAEVDEVKGLCYANHRGKDG